MEQSDLRNCSKCNRSLSPEEKLLNAIFCGPGKPVLCLKCEENRRNEPLSCEICNQPTNLSLNGVPRCSEHMIIDINCLEKK